MTPDVLLTTAGSSDATDIRERLVSLSLIDEKGNAADRLELVIDNVDGKYDWPEKDTDIGCSLGYENALEYMGTYKVDDVQITWPVMQIRIMATGSRFRSTMRERRRTAWANTTVAAMIETIARRNGFDPAVSEHLVTLTVPAMQQSQSDSDFLLTLADRYALTIKPVENRLVAVDAKTSKTASGEALEVIELPLENTMDVTLSLSGRMQFTGVRAGWYDMETATTVFIVAGDHDGKVYEIPETLPSEDVARQVAASKLDDITRKAVTLSIGAMPGDPRIMSQRTVKLSGGTPDIINGEWLITRAEHTLDSGGYLTRFEAKAPRQRAAVKLSVAAAEAVLQEAI